MIRDSKCWDRRTLKRSAPHRKKLGPKGSNFTGVAGAIGAIFGKILRRNDSYLAKETREGNQRGRDGLEIVLEIVLGDGLGGGLIIPGPHAAPGLALRRDPMPRWIAPRSIQI